MDRREPRSDDLRALLEEPTDFESDFSDSDNEGPGLLWPQILKKYILW